MTLEEAARRIAWQIERRSIEEELERLAVEIEIWNGDLDAIDRWENEGGPC